MAEVNGGRVTTVLAADADLQVGVGSPPLLYTYPHQPAHAVLIKRLEGIGFQDVKQYRIALRVHFARLYAVHVLHQELALGVIAAVAKGHLRQVIGAEGEKVSVLGDLTGGESSAGHLDHRAEHAFDLDTFFFHHLLRHHLQFLPFQFQFIDVANQRDHHLRYHLDAPPGTTTGGLEVSTGLHLRQSLVHDPSTAPAQPHHRIDLPLGIDHTKHLFLFGQFWRVWGGTAQAGDLLDQFLTIG